MGPVVLPQWVVFFICTFGAFIIGWAVWATVSIFKTQSDQRLNDERDINFRTAIGEKIGDIKADMNEIKTDFKNLSAQMVNIFAPVLKEVLKKNDGG